MMQALVDGLGILGGEKGFEELSAEGWGGG